MLSRFWLSGYNILLCGFLGTCIGFFLKDFAIYLKPLGDVFMQLIRMLIVPIVIFSILNSTAKLSGTNKAGYVGVFSSLYFFFTTLLATLIGLALAIYFKVGEGLHNLPQSLMHSSSVYSNTVAVKLTGFWDFIIGIIPTNPLEAIAKGNIIQILVFTIFLGIAISYLNNSYKDTFLKNISLLNDAFLFMMSKVMYITPLGVLGLTAYAVSTLGLDIMALVLKLFLFFVLGAIFLVYGVLGLLVHFFSNVSYFKFFKHLIPLKVISFTTASSLVSLPTNIKNCTEMGLNKNIINFVLPIGATVNMNGNAMFHAMAAIFFAQFFGIDITLNLCLVIVFTSIIGAIGAAGIPGPSLLVVVVLASAGIPLEGIPLLFAVDRLFDMLRTSVNVIGDASCVAILDKTTHLQEEAV